MEKFAKGYNGYKLIWIFLTCSVLGAFVEMIWCYFTMGKMMSRSSLLFGQFSIVWGMGCVLLTVLLHCMKNQKTSHVFWVGTLTGGIYEYVCSLLTEYVFGVKFWDYSHIPLNIQGRVNVLFCLFWGLIAVVWLRIIYPWLSQMIERIPPYFGIPLTWCLVVFLVYDMTLSAMALVRGYERQQNIPAQTVFEQHLDKEYDDEFLSHRYQNMKLLK